jgi:uncharacterized membrane protein
MAEIYSKEPLFLPAQVCWATLLGTHSAGLLMLCSNARMVKGMQLGFVLLMLALVPGLIYLALHTPRTEYDKLWAFAVAIGLALIAHLLNRRLLQAGIASQPVSNFRVLPFVLAGWLVTLGTVALAMMVTGKNFQ